MYPQRDLIRLAAYKAALQRDIARHRTACAAAVDRVAQPLELFDRILALWRRISPFAVFAAVPLSFLIQRSYFPRLKILRLIVRWSPLVVTAIRRISSLVTTRSESRPFFDKQS
jgi:hypothetical protein